MIEYVKGIVVQLTPASVIIETQAGLAFQLHISLNTYTVLENSGERNALLYVHESIREDAWTLYGFVDEGERAMFRALIGVSGVGASTARIILSSHTAAEMEQIIAGGDVRALKSVKGIGAKTAERIIVDLRDKIKPTASTLLPLGKSSAAQRNDVFDEALAALVMLGFNRQQSQKALGKIFDTDPLVKVEEAIKRALAML